MSNFQVSTKGDIHEREQITTRVLENGFYIWRASRPSYYIRHAVRVFNLWARELCRVASLWLSLNVFYTVIDLLRDETVPGF